MKPNGREFSSVRNAMELVHGKILSELVPFRVWFMNSSTQLMIKLPERFLVVEKVSVVPRLESFV